VPHFLKEILFDNVGLATLPIEGSDKHGALPDQGYSLEPIDKVTHFITVNFINSSTGSTYFSDN